MERITDWFTITWPGSVKKLWEDYKTEVASLKKIHKGFKIEAEYSNLDDNNDFIIEVDYSRDETPKETAQRLERAEKTKIAIDKKQYEDYLKLKEKFENNSK